MVAEQRYENRDLPVDALVISPMKYRSIHTESQEFKNLRENIKKQGWLPHSRILVRPLIDPNTGKIVPDKFEVSDGNHRRTIADELGLKAVPCTIDWKMTDLELQKAQFRGNEFVPSTLKERSTFVIKFASQNPDLTHEEIADDLGLTAIEVGKLLKFGKLIEEAQELAFNGDLTPTAAIHLSTVPLEFQKDVLEHALSMPVNEFIPFVAAQRKAFAKASRENRKTVEFEATPRLMSPAEIKNIFSAAKRTLESMSVDDPEFEYHKGRFHMVQELLQLDPTSIEKAKAIAEERKLEAQRKRATNKARKATQDAEQADEDYRRMVAARKNLENADDLQEAPV